MKLTDTQRRARFAATAPTSSVRLVLRALEGGRRFAEGIRLLRSTGAFLRDTPDGSATSRVARKLGTLLQALGTESARISASGDTDALVAFYERLTGSIRNESA